MHYVRLAILAVSLGVGLIASAQTPARSHANLAEGKQLFHEHCSVCHGPEGKGDGSMYDPSSGEPERRTPPADLTVLSERNSGKFPADRVRNAIYFKGVIPAHGTPDMPAWGDVFYLLKSRPKLLEKTVNDLTAYIESIQTKK